MPLNNAYDEQAVIQAIASALETFYGTLIEKIDGLNIQKVMKRKNPYLYRAKAMQSATEIVDSVLTAFVSSSEETIFGNCFFEPIAIAASGGNKALAEGIDIMIQNNETNTISAIAVKSGPSVFNADSKKRQEQNFTAASKLAQQAKARYEAYIGYCYGKKKESGRGKPKMYQELAGKRFWAELTGDEERLSDTWELCRRNMWLIIKKVITEQLIDLLGSFLIVSAEKMEVLTGKSW